MDRKRVEKVIGEVVRGGKISMNEGIAILCSLDAIGSNPELLNVVQYGNLAVREMTEFGQQREEQS